MTTDVLWSGVDGQLTERGRIGGCSGPAVHGWAPRWTDAHTEAARFLGECIGAGALLGMVAAMSRAWSED